MCCQEQKKRCQIVTTTSTSHATLCCTKVWLTWLISFGSSDITGVFSISERWRSIIREVILLCDISPSQKKVTVCEHYFQFGHIFSKFGKFRLSCGYNALIPTARRTFPFNYKFKSLHWGISSLDCEIFAIDSIFVLLTVVWVTNSKLIENTDFQGYFFRYESKSSCWRIICLSYTFKFLFWKPWFPRV